MYKTSEVMSIYAAKRLGPMYLDTNFALEERNAELWNFMRPLISQNTRFRPIFARRRVMINAREQNKKRGRAKAAPAKLAAGLGYLAADADVNS
jgi:hypothetical protein